MAQPKGIYQQMTIKGSLGNKNITEKVPFQKLHFSNKAETQSVKVPQAS